MIDNILGIDLGTSSVKLIYSENGVTVKEREGYDEISPDGWWRAICRAAKRMDLKNICAVGLSSQVGTYVTDDGICIEWNRKEGKNELCRILDSVKCEEFLSEISMPHPMIVSYPLPRLLYLKEQYPRAKSVCMPKDLISERLTGERVTDMYSWRGLSNLERGGYSQSLIKRFGLEDLALPRIVSPFSKAGEVTTAASEKTGIKKGTPVYVGCNDFFSGLLGMGISRKGEVFDITGTSEHVGVIRENIPTDNGGLVCGPFFFDNVHYGVTASSGPSFDFASGLGELKNIAPYSSLKKKPPIFLPYLCGERAPIWDSSARGVFFGIERECQREEMVYSVAEGVVFSLYHIYECMGVPNGESIITAGGAGSDPVLNKMKASLFGMNVKASSEKDSSALGAVMCAAVGEGEYGDLMEAMTDNVRYGDVIEPDLELGKILKERFQIYKRLYPALKSEFELLK